MMSTPEKGGIYENYDALTGEVGWIWENRFDRPFKEMPTCFQFGWSSTFVIEMLTDELVKYAGEEVSTRSLSHLSYIYLFVQKIL
jgi:hypothetical protein